MELTKQVSLFEIVVVALLHCLIPLLNSIFIDTSFYVCTTNFFFLFNKYFFSSIFSGKMGNVLVSYEKFKSYIKRSKTKEERRSVFCAIAPLVSYIFQKIYKGAFEKIKFITLMCFDLS